MKEQRDHQYEYVALTKNTLMDRCCQNIYSGT